MNPRANEPVNSSHSHPYDHASSPNHYLSYPHRDDKSNDTRHLSIGSVPDAHNDTSARHQVASSISSLISSFASVNPSAVPTSGLTTYSSHLTFENSTELPTEEFGKRGFFDFTADDLQAVMGLLAVLVQCFALIIAGYVSGRVGVNKVEASHTLNTFVSWFALPALIFKSLATMEDLSKFNWSFVISILVSKLVVFTVVAAGTAGILLWWQKRRLHLTPSPSTERGWVSEYSSQGNLFNAQDTLESTSTEDITQSSESFPPIVAPSNLRILGQAGLLAIFATQSNDFAFGYPLLKSLYAKDIHMAEYLYVLAPIQLVIINPMGLVLMEIDKSRRSPSTMQLGGGKRVLHVSKNVMKGIVTNPVIVMTVLGLVWNVTIRTLPEMMLITLDSLSEAFSATTLFLLGLRLVGKFQALAQGKNAKVLLATISLTLIKIVILPLVMRFMSMGLTRATKSCSCEDEVKLTNFALLYGTFPAAPTVFVFALQYGLPTTIVSSGLVLSSTLAAPLMFLAANLIRSNGSL